MKRVQPSGAANKQKKKQKLLRNEEALKKMRPIDQFYFSRPAVTDEACHTSISTTSDSLASTSSVSPAAPGNDNVSHREEDRSNCSNDSGTDSESDKVDERAQLPRQAAEAEESEGTTEEDDEAGAQQPAASGWLMYPNVTLANVTLARS